MEDSKTEILSFDIDEYNSRECQVHNHGFYLGEQSKQAEVDELIDTIKTSSESEMYLFDELQKVEGERDKLQKRIDDLKAFCIKGVEPNMLSIEYNQALIDMHKILVGEETK